MQDREIAYVRRDDDRGQNPGIEIGPERVDDALRACSFHHFEIITICYRCISLSPIIDNDEQQNEDRSLSPRDTGRGRVCQIKAKKLVAAYRLRCFLLVHSAQPGRKRRSGFNGRCLGQQERKEKMGETGERGARFSLRQMLGDRERGMLSSRCMYVQWVVGLVPVAGMDLWMECVVTDLRGGAAIGGHCCSRYFLEVPLDSILMLRRSCGHPTRLEVWCGSGIDRQF
ncbi:hypothetical protein ANO11243_058130 [Dothideomycetidae sp. 11243]|nr:hypothetical protein ANO11243_058130 [fungal sp. No.11243]